MKFCHHSVRFFNFAAVLLLSAGISLLPGCGGGGGGGSTTPPPPNYSLSLSSNTVSVSGGQSASVTVTVVGTNGFASGVNIAIDNVPANVTLSPTSANITAGQSQKFTFTAPTYVAASTTSLTVAGSSGPGYDQSATFSLQVAPYTGNISLSRTGYVWLDAANPNTVFFDSNTNRFFMSDPGSNQIMVVDGSTHKEVGTIAVPGAYSLDETPDHNTMWVGTEIGDVYSVNPVSMTVTQRYEYSQIGPSGFQADVALALANGDVALQGNSGGGASEGAPQFAVWTPSTNALTAYGSGTTLPASGNCFPGGVIGGMSLTGDRKLIVVSNGDMVCTLDPVSGAATQANVAGYPVTTTPDGKSILVLVYGVNAQMIVLNAQTLAQTASFPVVGLSGASVVVSPDSSTVYLYAANGIAYGYNIASGAQTGWMPIVNIGSGTTAAITAMDNTALLVGPLTEGMGFLDTTAMQTGAVGTGYSAAYVDPATGPASGGTQTNLYVEPTVDLTAVYFGTTLASSLSPTSGLLYATTPAGSPGPVDVDLLFADGGAIYMPRGFSYGPSIVEVTTNVSTADGGATAIVYGYGFGPITGQNHVIPSGLSVSVGGSPATITDYNLNPYQDTLEPTPIESITFTVPPGAAGASADIAVTSASGTTTLNNALTYLPAVQQVTVSGTASLAQGIYDPTRDVYYFTDTAEIRVYSRTQNEWLTPIQVPAAPAGTTHQLWGIGLSPSGNMLAVADLGAGMIYVLDPDTPGTVRSFVFNEAWGSTGPEPGSGSGYPISTAVSDSGMVYFTGQPSSCFGCDAFFKLDTATGNITSYGVQSALPSAYGFTPYKGAITSDNSTVFFNNDGGVFSVDTSTDKVSYALNGQGCCYGDYDLTLAAGQSTFEATSYLWNTNLNAESYLTLDDPESVGVTYVYGTQLSGDGTMLFQPSTNGIDVYDGRLGTLLERIALPVALSQNYDALVGDGKDNVLIAITGNTGNGIAIVDLSALAEPSPLPYRVEPANRMAGTASVERRVAAPVGGSTAVPSVHSGRVPVASIPHAMNGIALQQKRLTAPAQLH